MALTTRQGKGQKLTVQEMDNNLLYLEQLAQGGGTFFEGELDLDVFIPDPQYLATIEDFTIPISGKSSVVFGGLAPLKGILDESSVEVPLTEIFPAPFNDLVKVTGKAFIGLTIDPVSAAATPTSFRYTFSQVEAIDAIDTGMFIIPGGTIITQQIFIEFDNTQLIYFYSLPDSTHYSKVLFNTEELQSITSQVEIDFDGDITFIPDAGSLFADIGNNGSTVRIDNTNTASGSYSTVGGGRFNTASCVYSTVSGGGNNTASGGQSTVSGGRFNTASCVYSTVGGGLENTASGGQSTVSGGRFNTASGFYSTVSGGYGNTASCNCSTVGGGSNNTASFYSTTIGGGKFNTSSAAYSTVSGGFCNSAINQLTFIGGGTGNIASNSGATIVGGVGNTASGGDSFIGTGQCSIASGSKSIVVGGNNNQAICGYAVVVGGCINTASGNYSAILGGKCNNTNGCTDAMIVGSCITADHTCTTFVNCLSIKNIPTSAVGLCSGMVWNDGGTLKIVS
jgi:hypothetical protein